MKLLVMRHGIAEAPLNGDFSRALTTVGRQGVKRTAKDLIKRQQEPNKVFASPLVRAQQTATLVVAEICPGLEVNTLDQLSPEGNLGQVMDTLTEMADTAAADEVILLVSHQPFVSYFVHALTGVELFMDTAEVICISIEIIAKNCGEIEWHLRAS